MRPQWVTSNVLLMSRYFITSYVYVAVYDVVFIRIKYCITVKFEFDFLISSTLSKRLEIVHYVIDKAMFGPYLENTLSFKNPSLRSIIWYIDKPFLRNNSFLFNYVCLLTGPIFVNSEKSNQNTHVASKPVWLSMFIQPLSKRERQRKIERKNVCVCVCCVCVWGGGGGGACSGVGMEWGDAGLRP